MLNAQEIVDGGLLKLEHSKGKAAQIGYDLSLKAVNRIGVSIANNPYNLTKDGNIGKVLKDKTELTTYTDVKTIMLDGVEGWLLYRGAYDITFWEGCNIPSNLVGLIRQRSSMLRNGTVLHSSVFDPGFETEFMGTVMVVNETIFVERNARVAQIYFHECTSVDDENLYRGQWQNDKQRSSL
jgi:deoxycytidine triphosphate deaminase